MSELVNLIVRLLAPDAGAGSISCRAKAVG